MMRTLVLFAAATLGACSSEGANAQMKASSGTRFVAPAARGTGDGLSEHNAAGDLPRAVAQAVVDPQVSELVLLPGRYALTSTITVKPGPKPLVIRSSVDGAAVLDGRGVVTSGLFINGSDLTVKGLTFQRFRENGVVMLGGERLVIDGNRFANIASTTWSQAAIHGVHDLVDVRVVNNVISDTGYSGILFEAGEDGRLSDIAISNNRLTRTCLTVGDCGAIYAQGRAKQSGGFIITSNVIRDFGPVNAQAQGIYLDDGLSGAMVSGNTIAGTGEFAFHIHGGGGNRVTRNTVDVCAAKGVLFYQDLTHPMINNLVRDNILRLPRAGRGSAVKLDISRSAAIGLAGNTSADCSR
jgi:parallel beta-helix repeat protein